MEIKRNIAKNTLLQIIGKIVATVMGIMSLAIMARYLGVEGFGSYSIIISFVSFFAMSADLGLTLISAQTISNPKENESRALSNLFSLRLFSALVLLSAAPIVAYFFPYSFEIKIGILISTLIFLFPALNQIPIAFFQKHLRMDKVMIAEIISKVLLVVSIFIFAKLDLGLLSMLWASVISAFVSFLILWIYSNKIVNIKLNFDWKFWIRIVKKTWPIALTIILNLIYLKGDILLLSLFKPRLDVGIYAASHRAIEVIGTIPYMFAGIMLPIFTASWFNNHRDLLNKYTQKSVDFMIVLAIPLAVGTQFIAHQIIMLVAGPDFRLSGGPLQILIISTSMLFISCIFSHIIIAVEKQKKVIKLYAWTAIVSLIFYLILIPKYSYTGAAVVTLISNAMILFGSMYYVYKFTNFKLNYRVFKKSIIAAAVMAIFLLAVPKSFYQIKSLLALTVIIAGFIYFTVLYTIKGISRDDVLSFLPNKSNNTKI